MDFGEVTGAVNSNTYRHSDGVLGLALSDSSYSSPLTASDSQSPTVSFCNKLRLKELNKSDKFIDFQVFNNELPITFIAH